MTDRVLVTGGAGFIGSNLVRGLLAAGREVVVLDDLSSGRACNLIGLEAEHPGRFSFVRGSILDTDRLARAIAGCRHVFHLAAQVAVPASIEDPATTHEVNATGTMRVFEAARAGRVERVVFAASCAVYGNEPSLPKREGSPVQVESPYAASKYLGELYARVWTHTMGQPVTALRFFNVFGPRQDPVGGYAAAIPIFISRMLTEKPLTICGDGEQTRDFVFVEDVVAALIAASITPGAPGEVFNIGGGRRISVLDLVRALRRITRSDGAVSYGPARVGEVRHSVADIGRAARVLRWRPRITLDEGLSRTVAWYRREQDT